MALLFPFREICTHNQLQEIPPFILRRSDFALSRIRWSSACLSNLRNPKTVNADPSSFSFGLFLIAISAVAVSSNLFPRFPKPDFLKFRHAHKVDLFNAPLLHRDFGLRNIANPNAKNSELHSTKLRNGQRSLTPCQ
jgi:hypothetical protein